MGVTGLNEYLKKNHPEIYKSVHLSNFAFKKVCFDISSYIYRYISAYGKENNKWIEGFISLIMLFQKNRVYLIPIFDGKAPPEKNEERNSRREERDKGDIKVFQLEIDVSRYKETGYRSPDLIKCMRGLLVKKYNIDLESKHKRLLGRTSGKAASEEEENFEDMKDDDIDINIEMIEDYLTCRERNLFSVDTEDIMLLKGMCDQFKIPYLDAPDEAESLCNALVKSGKADITFSLDSDCIAYQVPTIINALNVHTGICTMIYFNDICEALELEGDQVRLFCILLRNDYNRHCITLKGLGPVAALKLIQQYGTWQAILEGGDKFKDVNKKITTIKEHEHEYRHDRCIELFTQTYPSITKVPCWDIRINIDDIEAFLNKHSLKCNRDKIIKLWNPPVISFSDEIMP